MKSTLIALFVLIGTFSFAQSEAYMKMLEKYYNDFPTISCSQAARKIGNNEVVFLDTREKKEFQVSHIQGAKCVGYDNFSMNSVKNVDKDAEIIVYCSIGARSQNIGEKLVKAGYTNVKNMYGGLFLWSNTGLPKTDSNGKRTDKIHGYSSDWGKWITKGKVVY